MAQSSLEMQEIGSEEVVDEFRFVVVGYKVVH